MHGQYYIRLQGQCYSPFDSANLRIWPNDLCFEPSKTMEDSIEHFLGMMKTVKKEPGSITVANSIAATHLLHPRQSRKPSEA